MDKIISYILCFGVWPWLLAGLLGLLLGWLFWGRNRQVGDLSVEGEGQLRAEADGLRARINDLEGGVKNRDGEIGDLKAKLAAGLAGAAAATAVATAGDKDDDETYALEWRNRYLAARVKYLEGRISDAPKPKAKKAAPKKRVVKKVVKKAAPKKNMSIIARGTSKDAVDAYYANARKYDKTVSRKRIEELTKYCGISLNTRDASLVACSQEHERVTVAKGYCAKKLGMNEAEGMKAVEAVCAKMKGERFKSRVTFYHLLSKGAGKKKAPAKAAAKPRVLYDSPTDGKPDDLKLISGVGPKLEKLLNKNGVYYFRQIGAWNKSNVKMVNDKLDAFPGRIERDEWVRQAKGLAKGTGAAKPTRAAAAKAKPAKKAPAKKAAANPNDKYYAMVRKHDGKASKAVIDNIVKYCGVSLRSRDASLVACSDEKELDRIAKGFAVKKLGMKSGQAELVAQICQDMKSTRMKNRVAFYYLMAKKARKMSVFK